MQEDKLHADKKEADAKELPPDRQAARTQRQASATLRQDDVSSNSASATLYPNWILSRAGKHTSPDAPQPYWMPREGADGCLTLEEELDATSVFDPLQASQGAEGPRTPPHYSEAPVCIPQFDIAKLGVSFPDVAGHRPRECTPETWPQDLLLCAPPLWDLAEGWACQGVVHALAAQCH